MTLSREQIELDGTVYGQASAEGLEASLLPPMGRTIMNHDVPMSTIWPQLDLGPTPPVLQGIIRLLEANVHSFAADVCDATAGERILSWVDSGVEVYAYVQTGQIIDRAPVNMGGGAVIQRVTFQFKCTRTYVKAVSGDTTLWGG